MTCEPIADQRPGWSDVEETAKVIGTTVSLTLGGADPDDTGGVAWALRSSRPDDAGPYEEVG